MRERERGVGERRMGREKENGEDVQQVLQVGMILCGTYKN